ENGDNQGTEESAHNGARTARERGSANYGSGHCRKHDVRAACQGIGRSNAERLQDAGEAAQYAGEHKIPQLDGLDVDSSLPGSQQITAGSDGVESPARAGEDNLHHDHNGDSPDNLCITCVSEYFVEGTK